MNKKMIAIGVVIAAVVAFFAGWYVMFVHFGRGPAFPFEKVDSVEYLVSAGDASGTEPLMALTDSEETAMEMAEQYGITFVSFEAGVATFYTDEDVAQVIDRGEKNGYPPLYINQKRELYDTQISEWDPSMIGENSGMKIKK